MSIDLDKIAASLFEKIRSRFSPVSLGDENSKTTQTPKDARFFNFEYKHNGTRYGNITLSLADPGSLKVYFSKNISGSKMDSDAKTAWYAFLTALRMFAKRNILRFDPRDIARPNLSLRDIQTSAATANRFSPDKIKTESGTRPKHVTILEEFTLWADKITEDVWEPTKPRGTTRTLSNKLNSIDTLNNPLSKAAYDKHREEMKTQADAYRASKHV